MMEAQITIWKKVCELDSKPVGKQSIVPRPTYDLCEPLFCQIRINEKFLVDSGLFCLPLRFLLFKCWAVLCWSHFSNSQFIDFKFLIAIDWKCTNEQTIKVNQLSLHFSALPFFPISLIAQHSIECNFCYFIKSCIKHDTKSSSWLRFKCHFIERFHSQLFESFHLFQSNLIIRQLNRCWINA